jgi:hypothetical protein
MKITAGGALGLYVGSRFGGFGSEPVAYAQNLSILDAADIDKYVTPLLIPPVMPMKGKVVLKGGQNADYYEISVRQFQEQILPLDKPKTTV